MSRLGGNIRPAMVLSSGQSDYTTIGRDAQSNMRRTHPRRRTPPRSFHQPVDGMSYLRSSPPPRSSTSRPTPKTTKPNTATPRLPPPPATSNPNGGSPPTASGPGSLLRAKRGNLQCRGPVTFLGADGVLWYNSSYARNGCYTEHIGYCYAPR